jgi:hypothetical protein
LRLCNDRAELIGPDGEPAHTLRTGDIVSIHGQTGQVYAGFRPVVQVGESDGDEQPD